MEYYNNVLNNNNNKISSSACKYVSEYKQTVLRCFNNEFVIFILKENFYIH